MVNYIIDPSAPSAARVVYDYYGGASRFTRVPYEMMVAVDKADSAQYDIEDILYPEGWVLLNYLMDADKVKFLEKDRADQTIEVAACDQAVFFCHR
ncbi:hypothetical protein CCP4SC76_7010034 [Gammaproteobacteria bacterium]